VLLKAPAPAGWQWQGGTYKSAMAHWVLKGQTEVVCVVASESDAFVQAMLMEEGMYEAVVEKKKALFEQATKVHVANAQVVRCGEGVDHHCICSVSELPLGNSPLVGLMMCCAVCIVV